MRVIRLLLFSFIIVLNLCYVVSAQNPFVSFYGPEQYGAGEKNYDVTQDADGIIYVAN